MSDVTSVTAVAPIGVMGGTTTPQLYLMADAVSAQFLTGDMVQPTLSGSPILNAVSAHVGWFNVKDDFGAAGDGSTDDTAAIQSAINAAYEALVASVYRSGVVFFPPGRYRLTASLNIGSPEATSGGLMILGSGGQAMSTQQGSIIQCYQPGDVFVANVGGGGGVVFRDLHVDRGSPGPTIGATFNFQAVVNGCITNCSTENDYDAIQVSQVGSNAVSHIFIYGNDFRNVANRFFHCEGGFDNLHIWDNYIGGLGFDTTYVGEFGTFTSAAVCSMFSFRNNDIEGYPGGIIFNNSMGTLQNFWIENNAFDTGNNARQPCFQATASGSAQVLGGNINHNWMPIGNALQTTPNAIHLDAMGAASSGTSLVAGIHIEGNIFGGGTETGEGAFANGAAIHIANGASDITIVGGRANFEQNAIEIVGTMGTTDGITIAGFGANNPQNGYDSGPTGAANVVGIFIAPSGSMRVQYVTISGCNLSACSSAGLKISPAGGGSVQFVSVVGNDFWGYSTPGAAVSVSGGSNINVVDNPGYNPVGFNSSLAPAIATGSAIANPFDQPVRVFVVSPAASLGAVSITSASGGTHSTGLTPASSGSLVKLGVGEQITLAGTLGTPSSSWRWFVN